MDELARMDIYSTPVMKIDGETVVEFNPKRVDAALVWIRRLSEKGHF